MNRPHRRRLGAGQRAATRLAALALFLAPGCREADSVPTSNFGFALQPSAAGSHGCVGPDLAFSGSCAPCVAPLPLATLVLGPTSRITASASTAVLYATGEGGQVVQIDVSGATPAETEILAPGEVDAYLTTIGAATPAVLSGICVLPTFDLVIAEHTNNVLLAADLSQPGLVVLFAGIPDPAGGNADGQALVPPQALFRFEQPLSLAATGDASPIVVVPDSGNDSIRFVQGGEVVTIAGVGTPFFADGQGFAAGFDTPVGLTVRCAGTLLIAESGAAGQGGNRVRELVFGVDFFSGSLTTQVTTLVGDGAPATVGGAGGMASAFAPDALVSTLGGDIYWIDSGTGVLRRASGSMPSVDCPLFADCPSAVSAGGTFTAGGAHSATQTASGRLFVTDWDPGGGVGTLFEVTP